MSGLSQYSEKDKLSLMGGLINCGISLEGLIAFVQLQPSCFSLLYTSKLHSDNVTTEEAVGWMGLGGAGVTINGAE